MGSLRVYEFPGLGGTVGTVFSRSITHFGIAHYSLVLSREWGNGFLALL